MSTGDNNDLWQSTLTMNVLGWGTIVFLVVGAFAYPPGVLWGELPAGFPAAVPHPPSEYQGLHPYVFMIGALYLAWAILLIRGARNPKANAALFDWGILANLLHGLLMLPQAFFYPNEHAHLWADVPALLVVSAACWIWHPNRVAPKSP